MSDVIDEKMVTEEHLEELRGLQQQFDQLTKQYGELWYQRKLIEAELLTTDAAMDELESNRRAIIQNITAQYGSGEIDLATGAFLPDKK